MVKRKNQRKKRPTDRRMEGRTDGRERAAPAERFVKRVIRHRSTFDTAGDLNWSFIEWKRPMLPGYIVSLSLIGSVNSSSRWLAWFLIESPNGFQSVCPCRPFFILFLPFRSFSQSLPRLVREKNTSKTWNVDLKWRRLSEPTIARLMSFHFPAFYLYTPQIDTRSR